MASQKACKQCKTIFEGNKCPNCGSEEFSDNFKGKVIVLNPEESEVAKNLKVQKKGKFAIKIG
jgi:DNA-directed RNA polymerase subunit E"